MGGGHDDSAALTRCCAHQYGESSLGRRIQCRGRLVEQPERARGGHQARQRQAPPLPGREVRRRQVAQRLQADGREAPVLRGGIGMPPKIPGPEGEVLGDRQGRLERVEMAEIVGLLCDRALSCAALEAPGSGRRPGGGGRRSAAGAWIFPPRSGRSAPSPPPDCQLKTNVRGKGIRTSPRMQPRPDAESRSISIS